VGCWDFVVSIKVIKGQPLCNLTSLKPFHLSV
jgi:hypothetical protein